MQREQTGPATELTDLLFEKAGVGLCLVAADGTVLRVNAAWLRSTGFEIEQVIGEDILELFPDTRDMAVELHARARAGQNVQVPRHGQRINGRETWWEGSIAPVPMDRGVGLLITAREVTASTKDAQSAAASDLFDRMFEHSADAVLLTRTDGAIIRANGAACRVLGRSQDEIRLARRGGLVLDDDALRAFIAERDRTGVARGVLNYVRGDGSVFPVDVTSTVIAESDGVRQTFVVFRDLSDLRRTEAAVEASQDRLRRTLRLAHAGIWEWNVVTGEVYWSPENFDLYGVDPGDPLAYTRWEQCVHPDDVAATNAAIDDAVAGRTPEYRAEFRVVHPQRGTRWILGVGNVARSADGTALTLGGLNVDITDRKRAEELLRQSEERFRAMGETLPFGVWLCNERGGAEYVSQSFLDLLEMTQEQMREFGWTHRLPPEDVEPTMKRWLHCVNTGEMWDSEHRVLGPDGKYHHVLTRGLPVRDQDGKITCWVGINLDIDKRKAMEQALLDADRRKDEFLGVLSHELRNPLAPIKNSIFLLKNAEPDSDQSRRARDVIERQTEHLTRLVDDLLDVTRIARGKIELRRTRVDVRDVVRRTGEDHRGVIEARGITLTVHAPAEPAWVTGDPTRLAQIVGNLLQNSSKFTHRGGEVIVSVERRGDRLVEIRVRDNGVGIDPALLPRVFDPFTQGVQNLARTGGGLGLGLALVKGLAALHGGSVEARSDGPGRGAEFIVSLPSAVEEAPLTVQAAGHPRTGRRRRVLVVDDDRDGAETLAEVVATFGHHVEVALDGSTAIEKARAGKPDLVLCDLGLPGMSGYDVARALRAEGLDSTQLVAISGYAQPEDLRAAAEAGFDRHIAKPAHPDEIERLLG